MTLIVNATRKKEQQQQQPFSIITFATQLLLFILLNGVYVLCLIHSAPNCSECTNDRCIKYKLYQNIKSFAKQEIDFRNNQIQFAFYLLVFFFPPAAYSYGFVCDPVSCCRTESYRAKQNGNDLMTKLFECRYCKLKSTRHLTFRSNYGVGFFFFLSVVAIAIESKFYCECSDRDKW